MLHILVLILKIIGIVLLVLLGLLLAAVLLVLLVPLRYRLSGSWHGGPSGGIRLTWLLHAVSVRAAYEDGLKVTAKLFGFRVLDIGSDSEDGGPDLPEPLPEEEGWDGSGEDEAVKAMSAEDAGSISGEADSGTPVFGEEGIDLAQLPTLEEQLQQDEDSGYGGVLADEDSGYGGVSADEDSGYGGISADEDSGSGAAPADEAAEGGGLPKDGVPDDIIEKIEYLFSGICDKLELADRKRLWVQRFLEDPNNQKTLRLVWRQVKAMLFHILPRKAGGQITFGFDDPATTGQVLAACSVIYALYGTELTITPDFGQAVIDGDLQMKGRVRLGTLAALAVRVLADRNLWRIIKKVRKFLESGGN